MKKPLFAGLLAATLALSPFALQAEEYTIDTQGAHAFIQFKIQHLGYSWLLGRFNTFSGEFSYDEENPSASTVRVEIDPASIDSSHAERDKHLRGSDFLYVKRYPESRFVSTSFKELGDGRAELTGNFTFRGITQPLTIEVKQMGAGRDPWGGYRRGFEGRTKFALKDYGIDYDLGPMSQEVELFLTVEGIRK